MSHTYALLVLADPPQSTFWEDLHLALLPTVTAAIDHLVQSASTSSPGAKIYLDIALPVTRVAKEASSQAELRGYIAELLTGIYQLLSVVSQTHRLSSNFRNPVYPDPTVVLVHEKPESDNNDPTTTNDKPETLPLAFQDLEEFARSSRPWSRIFQVDSPQGDRIYRKLRGVTRSSIPTVLHESVQRLPAGIQMYIPPPAAKLDTAPATPDSDYGAASDQTVLVGVEDGTVKIADKVKLTMALMVPTREEADTLPPKERGSGSLKVVAQGESRHKAHAQNIVVDFLQGVLGIELEHDPLQNTEADQAWETILSDGTMLSVSFEESPETL